jgi:hypothetical protein
MAKSRKHRSQKRHNKTLLKDISQTTKKVIPVVSSGLKTVGTSVKVVAEKSAPVVEKGISGVYGALATGFDMGVKGVQSGVTMMSKKRRHKKRHTKNKSYKKK